MIWLWQSFPITYFFTYLQANLLSISYKIQNFRLKANFFALYTSIKQIQIGFDYEE